MQVVNVIRWRLVVAFQMIIILMIAPGCGWRKTMTFFSPSHKAAIEIWQRPIANELGIVVQYVSDGRKVTLYERHRETLIHFVHVYWSRDESTVGVLGTGSLSFGVALDTKSGKERSFEQIKKDIGQSIGTTYGVPRGYDPVEWAWSDAAFAAFSTLHPEIRLSYR